MFLCFGQGLAKALELTENSTIRSILTTAMSRFEVSSYIQGGPKKLTHVLLNSLTLSNINRFSKFLHCENQEKICNNIMTTLPCEMSVS